MTGSRRDSYTDLAYEVPTGQCMACRIRLTREWSVRAMHESKGYDYNVFATLTYNDENLPFADSLCREHLTNFHKRLRKKRPRFRFLACGEYGDDTDRPHYHGLYFNLRFADMELLKMVDGRPLYRSDELDQIWGHGLCNFYNEITPQSAGYVAGYTKKKTGKLAVQAYEWVDTETGEIRDREPEFKAQSNRPGIGADYALRWLRDIYSKDEIIHDGKSLIPPRYYDKLCEKHDPDLWRRVKQLRQIKSDKKRRKEIQDALADKSTVPYTGSDRHGMASDKILKKKRLSRNKHS